MNYKRIYDQIIFNAQNRVLESYTETHHIIPKCMGGSNDKENLADLTAKEHFICHRLLTKIYPNNKKLIYAYWGMCNQRSNNHQRYIPSSRAYSEARELYSKVISATRTGSKMSDETKQKISNSLKGILTPDYVKKKISIAKKGKVSHRKGKTLPDEVKQKIKLAKIKYWANKKNSELH